MRANGWSVGGWKREDCHDIFPGLHLHQFHPANGTIGLTTSKAISTNVLPYGLRTQHDTFILKHNNDSSYYATQLWESGIFLRQLADNELATRDNNYEAISFTSGGIDFYLDLHTGFNGIICDCATIPN